MTIIISQSALAENSNDHQTATDEVHFLDVLKEVKPVFPDNNDLRRQKVIVQKTVPDATELSNKTSINSQTALKSPTKKLGSPEKDADLKNQKSNLSTQNPETAVSDYGFECKIENIVVKQPIVMPSEEDTDKTMPKIDKDAKMAGASPEAIENKLMYEVLPELSTKAKNIRTIIKEAAIAFNIDPLHIMGPIAAEHTFNMDVKDYTQDKILRVMGKFLTKDSLGKFQKMLKDDKLKMCDQMGTQWEYWNCVEDIYDKSLRAKYSDGNKSIIYEYFNPLGKSFGLGQLSPFRALMVTDLVHQVRPDIPVIEVRKDQEEKELYENVYGSVINVYRTIYYVAATAVVNIQTYRDFGGFDISNNPGLTATLYNLGHEYSHAKKAVKAYVDEKKLPRTNYFGWLVNKHASKLRAWLAQEEK